MVDVDSDDHSAKAGPRQLRQFSMACLAFFCVLGVWRWIKHEDMRGLIIFCTVGLTVGVAGLWRPSTVGPLYHLAMAAAHPISLVVNRLVIAFLFFFLFTPLAWIFRQFQRDPLKLRKPQGSSYWSPIRPQTDPKSYFRQSL